jgi:hypothetical protein
MVRNNLGYCCNLLQSDFDAVVMQGLPFNVSQSPAFRSLVTGLSGDEKATVLSTKTYNDILDLHYNAFLAETSALLKSEFGMLFGTRFLNLMHDLWTNSAKDCVVGASVSFIDHNWVFRHLALLAVVKNDGHDASGVTDLIDRKLEQLFGLDVETAVKFTISDTAPAARKVSKQFDTTLQTDCVMHCLNLCIGYGVGLIENVQTRLTEDPVTKEKVKERVFVTEGGQFREGACVIRKLRALNKYFASSTAVQRGHRLAEVQRFEGLPELGGMIDVDVRVASVVKLFQRSIVNYTAYESYFRSVKEAKDDREVFTCISMSEWELVVEMEAIVHRLAEIALVESQAANMLSSTMYVLLRVAHIRMNSFKFTAYQLDGPRDEDTNETNFPRVERSLRSTTYPT